jgi:arsenate reductase (glutaredoxin)
MPNSTVPLIYHNPRCSKSREAVDILRKSGFEPEIIEYLKTPPSPKEIAHLTQLLGLPIRELLRKKESEYKALGIDNPTLSDDTLVKLIAQHPILLERPIVVFKDKALIARPPELLHDFLRD